MARRRPDYATPDAAARALDPGPRAIVAATSARRAQLEMKGAAAFTRVTQALFDLGADPAIIELSARAIDEELRHARIYRELAVAYGGDPPPLAVEVVELPGYPDADPRDRPALHVAGMCAVNETMACGFLDACLGVARAPRVRAAVGEVLADELRHGRIGWAWLASSGPTPGMRRAIQRHLVGLLDMQWTGWRAQIATLPPEPVPAHGCPSGATIEAAALATIREVVLPGFAHLGFDVHDAAAWLARKEAQHPPDD